MHLPDHTMKHNFCYDMTSSRYKILNIDDAFYKIKNNSINGNASISNLHTMAI